MHAEKELQENMQSVIFFFFFFSLTTKLALLHEREQKQQLSYCRPTSLQWL